MAGEAIKALVVKRMRELKPGDQCSRGGEKNHRDRQFNSQELTRVSETKKLRKECQLVAKENISKLQRAKLNATSEDGHQEKEEW